MNPWSWGSWWVLPPAATALRTSSSTFCRLSAVKHTSTSVLFVASQISFGVKDLNFGLVKSITKMSSDTTMQAAVSSVKLSIEGVSETAKEGLGSFEITYGKIDKDFRSHALLLVNLQSDSALHFGPRTD